MEGADPRERLNSAYGTALQKNWMLWPAVQAINFKFVPLHHRVLVVNIVSLGKRSGKATFGDMLTRRIGWNCYLSYINSQGGK